MVRDGLVRMSVDVTPAQHRKIKAYAASQGKTIRDFVTECVLDHLPKRGKKKEVDAYGTRWVVK